MEDKVIIGDHEYKIGQIIYRVEYLKNNRPNIFSAVIKGYNVGESSSGLTLDLLVNDEITGSGLVECDEMVGVAAGGYFDTYEQALEMYSDFMYEFLSDQLAILQKEIYNDDIKKINRKIVMQLVEDFK